MPKKSISLPTRVVELDSGHPHFSRQIIRAIGRKEILAELKNKFPRATRSELRAAARQANKDAWDARDRRAVANLTHPEAK